MLQELSIENFAIISTLRLDFLQGMTSLTGETGAGKSIIIDAVGLLTGGRGSSDFIRQGATKAVLEGVFTMPKSSQLPALMNELGIDIDDDVLIIQRELSLSGKNVCRVNNHIVTIANLKKIGEFLVDIHGQNEHQELMNSDRHLSMLDGYGGQSLFALKEEYHKMFEDYQSIAKKVQNRQKNEHEFAQRIDMLTFQSEEIAAAKLVNGEEEQLTEERNKLSNFQKIVDALSTSYEAINGSDSNSLDNIGTAMNELAAIETFDEEYKTIAETVQNSYYQLQEVSGDLARLLGNLELDSERLDEVEGRLELIRQLKRKYGESVEAVLSYYQKITEELNEVTFFGEKLEELEALLSEKRKQVQHAGLALRELRKKTAVKLEKSIIKELKELYMENTQFEVRFTELEMDKATQNGLEQVEFYITTNPGEPLKPLVKVASGGELSRVMLAIKTIFSQEQGMTSIVFDEVDTGVSGRVAQAIADKIHQISKNSQVLCITHLPQVAAVADYQYFIEKEVKNDRTQTTVQMLDDQDRIQEIARMLAGSEITKLTLEHAQELLNMAQN